jgi:hypothetical protein
MVSKRRYIKLFQVKGKVRLCTSNRFGKTYNYGVNNKMLSRIFYKLGVPSGCKVKTGVFNSPMDFE